MNISSLPFLAELFTSKISCRILYLNEHRLHGSSYFYLVSKKSDRNRNRTQMFTEDNVICWPKNNLTSVKFYTLICLLDELVTFISFLGCIWKLYIPVHTRFFLCKHREAQIWLILFWKKYVLMYLLKKLYNQQILFMERSILNAYLKVGLGWKLEKNLSKNKHQRASISIYWCLQKENRVFGKEI